MFTWYYLKDPTTKKVAFRVRKDENEEHPDEEEQVEEPITSSEKTVDFVLVYRAVIDDEAFDKIQTFVSNLEQLGFELEPSTFSLDPDVNFIKIYAPVNVLLHFAKTFGIELTFQSTQYKVRDSKPFKFMATELSGVKIYSPIYHRAKDAVLGKTPKTITSAEKGLIIHRVLARIPHGEERNEFGIAKLTNEYIFETAYPLHDGPFKWTENELLNDRQLLARYWSTLKCWYKQQPLDLIRKYFGSEIGFYFAWLGFYNRMLLPAAAFGLIIFFLGIGSYFYVHSHRSKEICESGLLLCPRCMEKNCPFEPLKNSCTNATLVHLLDHPLSFEKLLYLAVSFAATVFVELWRREEAVLQIRWNLRSLEADYAMRPEFEYMATNYRISAVSGETEPYMSKKEMCKRYTLSFVAVLLCLILMGLALLGIVVYVKLMTTIITKHEIKVDVGILAPVLCSTMSIILILIVDGIYQKISLCLTNLENHRTQIDFDNSFTYKAYALAFVNNYCVIFYIAFIKARFYTYPGDPTMWTHLHGIRSAHCDPGGCIVELGIQLAFCLIGKNLFRTAKQFIVPQVANFCRRKDFNEEEIKTQWEQDYLLNPVYKYHVMGEYMQMIIQYGFVTFFIAAFPPAPLLALFNNIIELRVDAFKITCASRRPVPYRVPNLGAWKGILQMTTYIGVATNAFVIAFTSEFVQRSIYVFTVRRDLQGYLSSLLSVYNVSEYTVKFKAQENISVCYYPGDRYSPDHPRKYEFTDSYWFNLTIKFLVVVIFEHFVMILTGIIAYSIPDVPFSVKRYVNYQKKQLKESQIKVEHERYLRWQGNQRIDITQEI